MTINDELLYAPYGGKLRDLVKEIAGDEIGLVGRAAEEALHGDPCAVTAYVRAYRRLARALLRAATESRSEIFVSNAAGHVELHDRSGARAGWIEAVLDQSAAEAPFSRWAALLGLREGVAVHALASLRALAPGSEPLDPPATTNGLLAISDLDARRFLQGVRRGLNADQPPLERIQEVFGLTYTELGALFGVTRQGVSDWIERGVPARRLEKVATVAAIADLLERKLKFDRIAGIARRPADAYGGLTLIELIRQDRHHELLDITQRSFDWATATVVAMNAQGRLTVPVEARKALGLVGGAQFQAEISDEGLLLRQAVLVPREDAWAYTSEHRSLLARAREDSARERVRELSEDDLRDMADTGR